MRISEISSRASKSVSRKVPSPMLHRLLLVPATDQSIQSNHGVSNQTEGLNSMRCNRLRMESRRSGRLVLKSRWQMSHLWRLGQEDSRSMLSRLAWCSVHSGDIHRQCINLPKSACSASSLVACQIEPCLSALLMKYFCLS
jgi:hypothetical protein